MSNIDLPHITARLESWGDALDAQAELCVDEDESMVDVPAEPRKFTQEAGSSDARIYELCRLCFCVWDQWWLPGVGYRFVGSVLLSLFFCRRCHLYYFLSFWNFSFGHGLHCSCLFFIKSGYSVCVFYFLAVCKNGRSSQPLFTSRTCRCWYSDCSVQT